MGEARISSTLKFLVTSQINKRVTVPQRENAVNTSPEVIPAKQVSACKYHSSKRHRYSLS